MNNGQGEYRRNIRLLVAYDGTDFSGWQRQKSGSGAAARTVQGEIEAALERIHQCPTALAGSGRTDSGVHAAGQVANFRSSIKNMEARRFVPALNGLLPRDIRILEARETRPDFHARFDAKSRTYRYYFVCGRRAMPWELRYSLQLWRRPRLERLNDYARLLPGELDCSVFAVPGDKSKSRNRYISQACFFAEGDRLVFEISANAFLWKMVRSIAGTILHYEEKGLDGPGFKEILASRNRSLAGPTAPPEGLFLWKIDYYRD
ncbi:MAG: tRNA pseudouridine(38-40) synthase TruA [Treponema sp.]|jgi:tRNA pseudouridine38-40 synthase|nr:tRNA pseudouridine(38-40) synthase TruA [Treponema sp.]